MILSGEAGAGLGCLSLLVTGDRVLDAESWGCWGGPRQAAH